MGARGTTLSKRFDYYKRQGKTDEQAMKLAMKDSSVKGKKPKKLTKDSWASRLKMGVTKRLALKKHSKAGRKYLASR